jgi:hypothetical protein
VRIGKDVESIDLEKQGGMPDPCECTLSFIIPEETGIIFSNRKAIRVSRRYVFPEPLPSPPQEFEKTVIVLKIGVYEAIRSMMRLLRIYILCSATHRRNGKEDKNKRGPDWQQNTFCHCKTPNTLFHDT